MRYPTVVAFDLESVPLTITLAYAVIVAYFMFSGTIWSNWLDPSKFRSRNDLEIHGNVIRNKWFVDYQLPLASGRGGRLLTDNT